MKSPQEKSFKREEEGGRGSYEFLQFLTLSPPPKAQMSAETFHCITNKTCFEQVSTVCDKSS